MERLGYIKQGLKAEQHLQEAGRGQFGHDAGDDEQVVEGFVFFLVVEAASDELEGVEDP